MEVEYNFKIVIPMPDTTNKATKDNIGDEIQSAISRSVGGPKIVEYSWKDKKEVNQ